MPRRIVSIAILLFIGCLTWWSILISFFCDVMVRTMLQMKYAEILMVLYFLLVIMFYDYTFHHYLYPRPSGFAWVGRSDLANNYWCGGRIKMAAWSIGLWLSTSSYHLGNIRMNNNLIIVVILFHDECLTVKENETNWRRKYPAYRICVEAVRTNNERD